MLGLDLLDGSSVLTRVTGNRAHQGKLLQDLSAKCGGCEVMIMSGIHMCLALRDRLHGSTIVLILA